MKTFILLITLFLSFNILAQKKKECDEKLNSKISYLSGQWKFLGANFFPSAGGQEPIFYPEQVLNINNTILTVKNSIDTTTYQKVKFKLEKENPAKYGNCELLIKFKTQGYPPAYSYNSDLFYEFWLIGTCNKDSLVLCTPWTTFKNERNGLVEKYYIRQK